MTGVKARKQPLATCSASLLRSSGFPVLAKKKTWFHRKINFFPFCSLLPWTLKPTTPSNGVPSIGLNILYQNEEEYCDNSIYKGENRAVNRWQRNEDSRFHSQGTWTMVTQERNWANAIFFPPTLGKFQIRIIQEIVWSDSAVAGIHSKWLGIQYSATVPFLRSRGQAPGNKLDLQSGKFQQFFQKLLQPSTYRLPVSK